MNNNRGDFLKKCRIEQHGKHPSCSGAGCVLKEASCEHSASRELNSFSPHLALSVSPWPCQRLSWSSCSSRSTRLGLYAEFISKVNTWTRDKHRVAAFKRLSLRLGVELFILLCAPVVPSPHYRTKLFSLIANVLAKASSSSPKSKYSRQEQKKTLII